MLTVEYIILVLLYTSLTISLFFQWLCYKKKMEHLETITFTISILLLVISISLSPLLPKENTTNIYTLVCMTLIGLTTFLQTLREQKHNISKIYKKVHIGISIALTLLIIIAKVFKLIDDKLLTVPTSYTNIFASVPLFLVSMVF